MKHVKRHSRSSVKPPDWSLPFEIMCDASDFIMGAVLGQHVGKLPHIITMLARL
jgi:hypothetical protein